MKKLFALLISAAFLMPAMAEEAKQPETKKVCVDVQGKDGKPVIDPKTKKPKQDCKEIKVHKKFEGTKVPEGTKK
jgi:hypothetical protein